MRPVNRLQKILQIRLQFLQHLLLIGSYQQLLEASAIELKSRHYRMVRAQSETVCQVLRTIRIDELFKKQFHRIVLRVFNRIEPGIEFHREPSGTYKQIISDYVKFFVQLQEKYIVEFIQQLYGFQMYNQTTYIYVLLQLVLKYLRIKCFNYIQDNIQTKVQLKQQTSKSFMQIVDSPPSVFKQNVQKSNSRMLINSQYPLIKQIKEIRGVSAKCRRETKSGQTIPLNYKTISPVGSNYPHQTLLKNRRNCSEKSKKTTLPRQKELKQQIKMKTQKGYEQIIRANQNYTNSFPYHSKFVISHWEEWKQYLRLIRIDDIVIGTSSSGNTIIMSEGRSIAKKREWQAKNNSKVIGEGCSRNQLIRKQIEIYSGCYLQKTKGEIS